MRDVDDYTWLFLDTGGDPHEIDVASYMIADYITAELSGATPLQFTATIRAHLLGDDSYFREYSFDVHTKIVCDDASTGGLGTNLPNSKDIYVGYNSRFVSIGSPGF